MVRSSRKDLAYYAGRDLEDKDLLRKKRCDWCATEVVTVEKLVAMLTPPKKDRIKQLGRSKHYDTMWNPRD